MRVDPTFAKYNLTKAQQFFVEAWFNMVHAHSLDSFRVRTMNPRNSLREILALTGPHWGDSDKRMVLGEACQILESDPVLREAPFVQSTTRLIELLRQFSAQNAKAEFSGDPLRVFQYFVTELQWHVDKHYLLSALEWMERTLEQLDEANAPTPGQLAQIRIVTGNLLSALIDAGASLEAMYNLYAQVLLPRTPRPNFEFSKRFDLLRRLLTAAPKKRRVALVLDSVSDVESFPKTLADFTFTSDFSLEIDAKWAKVKTFHPAPGRLFAYTDTFAPDERTAGVNALKLLNQVINLVRFEFEKSRISIGTDFACDAGNAPKKARIFRLPVLVPNPASLLDEVSLEEFVVSVNELVSSNRFDRQGLDRINAAFRLYRVGLDDQIMENKLVNWWSALEYFSRGSSAGGGIGAWVENHIAPVLCVRYLPKHLLALKGVLVEFKVGLTHPDTNQEVNPKTLTLIELFGLVQHAKVKSQVMVGLAHSVFISNHVSELMNQLCEPKRIHTMLKAHEERVRWQLQRIYRARCDIVHGSVRIIDSVLLCANLEYYLKSVLIGLLQEIRHVPTLQSPREYLDRQGHAYKEILRGLNEGRMDAVEGCL
jgi:hypothetical protein